LTENRFSQTKGTSPGKNPDPIRDPAWNAIIFGGAARARQTSIKIPVASASSLAVFCSPAKLSAYLLGRWKLSSLLLGEEVLLLSPLSTTLASNAREFYKTLYKIVQEIDCAEAVPMALLKKGGKFPVV
jgi:hypothetical protein